MKESGLDREDIFLETKLWLSFYEEKDAVDKTLDRLRTDTMDLMFFHHLAGNWKAGRKCWKKE